MIFWSNYWLAANLPLTVDPNSKLVVELPGQGLEPLKTGRFPPKRIPDDRIPTTSIFRGFNSLASFQGGSRVSPVVLDLFFRIPSYHGSNSQ